MHASGSGTSRCESCHPWHWAQQYFHAIFSIPLWTTPKIIYPFYRLTGCFWCSVVNNNAAMNVFTHVLWCTYSPISSGWTFCNEMLSHKWFENYDQAKTWKWMFVTANVYSCQKQMRPRCPSIDTWINNANPYNWILFSNKNKWAIKP